MRLNQNRAESKVRSKAKGPHDAGLAKAVAAKQSHGQASFADEARFIRAWFDNPRTAGAVSPSGRFLARMMARHVDPAQEGLVIELGPGTGPVTQALIQRGVAPERLVLVEFDAAFCRLLERRFPRSTVIQGDAVRLRETLAGRLEGPVAAVVSSLPLLNMPDAERLALLSDAFALMPPTGRFVQFTYGLASPMPKKPKGCRPVDFAAEVSPPVWLNLPPARVWVYRPALEVAGQRLRPEATLIHRLKAGRDKVKLEFRETRARVETEIRLRTDKARGELSKVAISETARRRTTAEKTPD